MRATPLLLAALVTTAAAACGGTSNTATSHPSTSPSPAAPTAAVPGGDAVVEVKALPGNRFSPSSLTLHAGDSVKVTDTDTDVPHNFVVAGVGRSQTMNAGDTFTLAFPNPGSYTFVCTFHQQLGMEGTITVSPRS